jgi:hypothetical protein
MKGLQKEADKVKKAGRYGDTELVHINKDELKGLASMMPMTRNPETGQPEMFLGTIMAALSALWSVAAPYVTAAGMGAASAAGSAGIKKLIGGDGGGATMVPGDVSGQTRTVSAPSEMLPQGTELSLEEMEYGAEPGFGGGGGGGGDDAGIMALLQMLGGGGGGGGGNLRNEQAAVLSDEDWEGYARGGPVGKVDDVFYFSSPQIQQMQMAPDPMTQNMGNMLNQQQQGGAPVPATVPQIQQMALGGEVQPGRTLSDRDIAEQKAVDNYRKLYEQMKEGLANAKSEEQREEIRKNWALTSENFEENTVFKAHRQMVTE